ncbi:arylesterase [Desulfobacter hydrogenophilus]|uniref:Arylesterase n=1 Tax=Desulfobacter hydrogenophilus TaxID=2291 RepID=A0A328FD94_9BACT|nr:arylesterase [Desulfobacter hydrogenophilus]NDY72455.1 arylesterase [Desulfobacter hydrogenophilus]QBH13775.1 arylesterase [Desulfobacter hydrogenophilus]RAM01720.1 arylesterase [Desulfobacter hydrogenophilus]
MKKRYVTVLLVLMVWGGLLPGIFPEAWGVPKIKILFIGDSITAGYGIAKEEAYPALLGQKLESLGIHHVEIINGSISGSTTASALSRLKWFRKTSPDILVLALGANDGLRGLSVENMEDNLGRAITFAKNNNMDVILAGMQIPPNYGPEYADDFKQVFTTLADDHEIVLIPFLLEGVGGRSNMNQPDGIHPNRAGHQQIAKTVFPFILKQIQEP